MSLEFMIRQTADKRSCKQRYTFKYVAVLWKVLVASDTNGGAIYYVAACAASNQGHA